MLTSGRGAWDGPQHPGKSSLVVLSWRRARAKPPGASKNAGDDATASAQSQETLGAARFGNAATLTKPGEWSHGLVMAGWCPDGRGAATDMRPKSQRFRGESSPLPMRARPCLPATQPDLTRARGNGLFGQCSSWAPANSSKASKWPEVAEPGLMRQVTQLSEMLRQVWLGIPRKMSAHDAGR